MLLMELNFKWFFRWSPTSSFRLVLQFPNDLGLTLGNIPADQIFTTTVMLKQQDTTAGICIAFKAEQSGHNPQFLGC
jgi:hypothetical protein